MKTVLQQLGRIEKAFLVILLIYLAVRLSAPASDFGLLVGFFLYVLGIVVAVRLARRILVKVIWRLRNRLIVAYVFIAIIPILLFAVLVGAGMWALMGQVAVYLVHSELERRIASMRGPAEMLARTAQQNRADALRRVAPFLQGRFPELQIHIKDSAELRYPEDAAISAPPPGWSDSSGLMVKDRRLYCWMHVLDRGAEVTMLAPIQHNYLAELIPGLGDALLLGFSDRNLQLDEVRTPGRGRLPPKYIRGDIEVDGVRTVPIFFWNSPGKPEVGLLMARTRTSAVLSAIMSTAQLNWSDLAWVVVLAAGGTFLIFELVSVIIGISITRTITSAVHNLYEGTQKIKEGDFSHRIAVSGNDQLADLSLSFNTMTENLQRLIVVEKEKERLQSEIEIAREVQSQLFPKQIPVLKTLQLTGICHPARMVSGDYYDWVALPETGLALAIGDVAGKGISAALLMAAIQSTMHTQLSAGVPATMAVGGGNGHPRFSAAHLVSQLNKQLYANTSPEKYATFCFGLYNDDTSVLTYTNAGHLPPILLRDGDFTELAVTGTVVGAFPFSLYEEQEVKLKSGDLLVAYTDGIVEPENEYGEQFGENRLKDLLGKYTSRDSDEIIARVMESVRQWTNSSELQDDMTILMVRHV